MQHSSTDRHSGLQPLENSSPPKKGAGRPALHRRGFNPAAPGKTNQVHQMSLARVMFFGSHPPSSRKQGGESRNDPLVGICTAHNGWHSLQLFLYEISCQQRPDQVRYLRPYVQGCSASISCVGGKDFHGCHRKGAGVLLGRICQAPSGGGPPGGTRVPGRKPRQGMALCQDGCFLGGKPLAAQCTGQLRVAPVPRRKPGVVFCLICLVILGVRPLITFGCRMESSRVTYSVPPPTHSLGLAPPRRPLWSHTGILLPTGSVSVRSAKC